MQTANLINGQWTHGGGDPFGVINPADDQLLAEVPMSGRQETLAAIDAASEALAPWQERTARDRADVLHELSRLLLEQAPRIGRILTMEQGKPMAESLGEIGYAASFLDWAAEEGCRIYGDTIPASSNNKRILVLKQPVGVTGAITPWNFPVAMITRKLGPALAAGCTQVIKPAEDTPLSALALGELACEAGVPPGVINIITGDPVAISDAMLGDPRLRKLSFTGSTEVGRILMQKASTNLTRLSLELGGHAPLIVFDDADLDIAVAGTLACKFRNMGQTCISANRFIVHDSIHDAFIQKLQDSVSALVVGNGLHEGVHVGPLINDPAIEKVQQHVDTAVASGATLVCGGSTTPIESMSDRFYQPTILMDVTPEMLICQEETFGPIVPVVRFTEDDEAVRLANATPYGLAAYFFTNDASRVIRVSEALEYGIVGVNDGAPSTAQAPFGGVKHSGYGREGGRYVMDEYLETKYVSWQFTD